MTAARSLARKSAFGAAAAILLCSGGLAAAKEIHVRVYAKAQEPQFFFYVTYNSCKEDWENDAQGCLRSLKTWVRQNAIFQYRLGNVDLDPDERVYFVPLCRGQLFWKNAEFHHAQEDDERELKCRP